MGDPECQTILPKLKTDLVDILLACCDGKLDEVDIQWLNKKSLCVVLCSKGYPDSFLKNVEIENLEQIEISDMNYLFHAGTIKKDNKIYAVGGRVLNFVSISDNFSDSKKNIIDNIERLNWPGGFYRKDIGYKVIK
jgi:phosphoribosylamine--glycine ligase